MINKDALGERLDFIDENAATLKEAMVFSFKHLDEKIDDRFDTLSLRIDDLTSSTERHFTVIELDINSVRRELNEGLDSLKGDIDRIGSNLTFLSEDVRSLDQKFTPLLGLLTLLPK